MAAPRLNHLSSFSAGPAHGTRSRRALSARRPTNLPTIPEADEDSVGGRVRLSGNSPSRRLRRSKRLAPIMESDEEDEESDVSTTVLPCSRRRPYSRVAPIISSDDEDLVLAEVSQAGESGVDGLVVDRDVCMDEDTPVVAKVTPPSSSVVVHPRLSTLVSSAVGGGDGEVPGGTSDPGVSSRSSNEPIVSNGTRLPQSRSTSGRLCRTRSPSSDVLRLTCSRLPPLSTPPGASADSSTSAPLDSRARRARSDRSIDDSRLPPDLACTTSGTPNTEVCFLNFPYHFILISVSTDVCPSYCGHWLS